MSWRNTKDAERRAHARSCSKLDGARQLSDVKRTVADKVMHSGSGAQRNPAASDVNNVSVKVSSGVAAGCALGASACDVT